MRGDLRVRLWAAAAVLVASATSAWAQDYTVTAVSGQWVTPPGSATLITSANFGNNLDDGLYTISGANVPFPISYFGKSYTSVVVSTNGSNWFGGLGYSTNYSPLSFPQASTNDGIVSVAQYDMDGRQASSACYYWTDGTSPNRRFIIAWTNWYQYSYSTTGNGPINFQVQYYENGGRIQFAYTSWASGTATASKGCGIDEYGGTRWVTPSGAGSYTFSGPPANDWRFDPKITNFTGRLLYDRYVVNANGIGNLLEQNLPLTGLRAELRNASGQAVGGGYCDSNGNFTVQGVALVGADVGSLVVTSQSASSLVTSTSGGTPYSATFATNVPFNADRAVGAYVFNASNDPTGTIRAPMNIVRSISQVYDWTRVRTANPIAQLEVLYDPASSLPTSYTRKAGVTPAQMRISGAASNPDPWDSAVIRKTYGRHILGQIAADPTSAYSSAFDAISSEENAFAEGFGYYMNAVVSGELTFVDGLSSSAATVLNLEDPPLVTRAGGDVAGSVAAALFDLVDPANEAWDPVDGTGTPSEYPFRTVDALTTPVTALSFYSAWGTLMGYDGRSLSTVFIHDGVIGDDGDEPNDISGQSRLVSQFGFIRTQRVLNLYNEDWYEFTMPQSTTKLTADVVYNRVSYNTSVGISIFDASGNVVVVGAPIGTTGNIEAVSGALPAGNYRVRIQHLGGVRLPDYALQVFSALEFSSPDFAPWTVARPYNVPVNIKGGIPPYDLVIPSKFLEQSPPGITFDGQNARVTGVPSRADTYSFPLTAQDSAIPPSSAAGPVRFVVNPELDFRLGHFLAFAYDRDVDRDAPYFGGTAPYLAALEEGALPHGISVQSGGSIRFSGHPDIPGSSYFKVDGLDVAGSGSNKPSMAVVCVPFGPSALSVGASAAGYYFDAVQGSSVNLSIKTVAGQPRRALHMQVLDVDGNTSLDARVRAGRGAAAIKHFVAPSTGRFYCIVASDDAGAATRLTSAGSVSPTKKGGGTNGTSNFVSPDVFFAKFGALGGATLDFTATPDHSGLSIHSRTYLLDPQGAVVPLAEEEVVQKGKGFRIKKLLPESGGDGTWTVIIVANPGPQGHFRYSFRLKEPGGVQYVQD